MPIIKFHVSENSATGEALERMAKRVHSACIDLLQAAPDAVQLAILTSTAMLRGEAIYIEVLYREQPHRNQEAMQRFMRLLHVEACETFGATPRIRCIAVDQSHLHALN